jgi:alkylglycerol monooxygenase
MTASLDYIQFPTTQGGQHDTITYHFPGLHLSFALPYFGILIVIEIVIFLCKYYTKYMKNGGKHGSLKNRNENLLYRWNDTFSSVTAGMIQQLVGKVFCKYLNLVSYCFVYHYWRMMSVPADRGLTSVWWWYAFILQDHQYYWFHRFIHECNMGWAAHAVHHSSEEYNLSTALRQGAFQQFFGFAFNLPLAFLGISPEMYAIQGEINLLYQYWIHTKVIGKLPWPIEYIFNTPSHHRAHHGRNPIYIDKNYGGTLIVFDRLYGTFEAESEEVIYGLVHPLQRFSPLWVQIHHWVDMWNEAKNQPSLWKKISVYVRGPGYNVSEGNWWPIPDTPPEDKLRKYDISIPYHATAFAFTHFVVIFITSVVFTSSEQTTYLHTLAQFVNICFGTYNMSLLFDGYFSTFCYYERIRYLLNWPVLLMNMFYYSRPYVRLVNYHIGEVFLKNQKISNAMVVFYLLSALYTQTVLNKYKDISRPEVQNWEQEREIKEE